MEYLGRGRNFKVMIEYYLVEPDDRFGNINGNKFTFASSLFAELCRLLYGWLLVSIFPCVRVVDEANIAPFSLCPGGTGLVGGFDG